MIRNFGSKLLALVALAVCILVLLPAFAQSQNSNVADQTGAREGMPAYDLSKEINIQGSVQKIEIVSGTGILGAHLQLQTMQGLRDVHLGSGAVVSAATLGLVIGQSVSITGMPIDFGGRPVMLARVLTTSNHIFILRNEHGLPARAIMPRGGTAAATAEKGGR